MPEEEQEAARDGNIVIGRRLGRGIFIGRGIRVTIAAIRGDRVDLAIEAPQTEAVSRDDVALDVHMEFQRAREDGERIEFTEALARARYARSGGRR